MKKIIAILITLVLIFSNLITPVAAIEESNRSDISIEEIVGKVEEGISVVKQIINAVHNLVGGILGVIGKECPFCDEVHITNKSKEHIVAFDLNYDIAENKVTIQKVLSGKLVEVPINPEREGYIFAGWHTSEECQVLFDFSTEIYQNYNLFARWVELSEDKNKDTDGDGLTDLEENCYKTSVYVKDTDRDGVSDYYEIVVLYTDPLEKDTDSNGITDYEEDFDKDGISNGEEIIDGTNPIIPDSDDDGISDMLEKITYKTDPTLNDTDSDGATDGWEVDNGFDPNVFNESFTVNILPEETMKSSPVSAGVSVNSSGNGAETLSVAPVSAAKMPELNPSIAGYLGEAFEFNSNEPIESAEITFTYDESLGELGEDFQPRIYYYNEATGFLEELPNQKIENGKVSVEVEHFSIYILLNKIEFDSVWDKEIKPIDYKGDGKSGIDVVFVVDSSGSMSSNDRNEIRKLAVKNFVDKLGSTDRAAVVDFDGSARVYQNFTSDHTLLYNAVNRIDSSGGTSLSAGMSKALGLFTNSYDRTDAYKYIIFLTDGQGSYSTSYTSTAKNNGIVVYTIGLGSGVSESVLKNIATDTDGKYYFASSASDLPDIYSDVSFETVDYSSDSNHDGISDYYTELICNGELVSKLGSTEFEGIDFNYDKDGYFSSDFDGDGLDNGEEIKLFYNEETGKMCWTMISDPMMENSDWDIYDDREEYKIGSNPRYNTYNGEATYGLISSDLYQYNRIVDLYDKNLDVKILQNFYGYGLTDGFIKIATEQIIDYMYDYVSDDYIDYVQVEMLRTSAVETLYDTIEEANKKIKEAKKYADKMQDAYEVISKATKLKVESKDLIGRINNLVPTYDAYSSNEALIKLLETDYMDIIKELNKLDNTALGRIDIKLYDIGVKYKKFFDKKVVSDISISDTFTLAQLGMQITETVITYSKINAISYVFEQNFDILESIQQNAKYFEVKWAANLISFALGNGYTSYVESVLKAITFDAAGAFIDEAKSQILAKNPIYSAYKLAMFILGIIGDGDFLESIYNILCYSDIIQCTRVLANQNLEKKEGNKDYTGRYNFYESIRRFDSASIRYLKHLTQLLILAEESYIELSDHLIFEENPNVPLAFSNINGLIDDAKTLKISLPFNLIKAYIDYNESSGGGGGGSLGGGSSGSR